MKTINNNTNLVYIENIDINKVNLKMSLMIF